jgi:multiple sugar transport system permease protein
MLHVGYRRKRQISNVLSYAFLISFMLVLLFPIYWIATISTKEMVDMFTVPPKFVYHPVLKHYREIFLGGGVKRIAPGTFLNSLVNSVKVSLLSVFFAAVLGIPGAYSVARFNYKGKNGISMWILTILMLPPVVAIIPILWLYKEIGKRGIPFYDTLHGLVIANMIFLVPFFIWILRGFFLEIPKDIEEAAMVDGCNQFQAFFRVLLPLAIPGISMTIILCIILSWNTFLFPFMLAGKNAMTAPVSITGFISFEEISWGKLAAGGLIMMLPPIILAFFFQKAIVRGLTFGAVKG